METSLFPDTAFAIALCNMKNKFLADGDDGSSWLAMPPTSLIRDSTASGVRFSKVFGDYVSSSISDSSTSHQPTGPIYCVVVSSDERRIFLGIIHHHWRLAPKEVEAFLDSLVKSVEIVR